jgi:predicted ATPase/class 3 adenylate cyclase
LNLAGLPPNSPILYLYYNSGMNPLPTGTVSFLFTDIEGSTPLWESQPEQMRAALQVHHRILHEAISAQAGAVFNIVGDGFLAAFPTAVQALSAAIAAQQHLAAADWGASAPLRVRMGVHTGEAYPDENGQYPASHTLNRASRVMSAGYGGQILLSGEAAELCQPNLPPGVTLLDLGLHQLKGLVRPEHIFQASATGLRVDFPLLASQLNARSNLPQQFTPFIGRTEEMTEINQLLANPECRILVLLGPGGIGKTRLAIQIAERKLAEFSHGACFAPLAGIDSTDGFLLAIAKALQLTFHQAGGDHRQQLLAAFQSRQMLVVLDNFEQLISEENARLLLDIVAEAPGIKLLVTTRTGLNLGIEWQYPLRGMSTPESSSEQTDPQVVETFSAVRLFIERARRIQPKFAVTPQNLGAVVHICRKVQGMPLGIELAAAWLDVLSPQEIASEIERGSQFLESELHDLPMRQRGLRAVFDSTWDLLTPHEREAFMTLSVFRGGFTRQAAEAVAGASLRDLSALANKSLLGRDAAGRYEIHELLRQFGEEQLGKSQGEKEAAYDRLADTFTNLLAAQGERMKTAEQAEAIQAVENDLENIRLGWEWAVDHCQVERLERALLGLYLYCDVRFLSDELQNGLETAAKHLEAAGPLDKREQRALAKMLTFLRLTFRIASSSQSLELQQRAMELRENLAPEDQMGVWFTYLVGISALTTNIATIFDHSEAIRLLDENLAYLRRKEDPWGCALTLRQLGVRFEILGQVDFAEKSYQEAANLFRSCGDQIQLAWCLDDLGGIAVGRNDYAQADALVSQAQEIFETLGEQANLASILYDRARYLEAHGKYSQALEYFQQSLDLCTKLGMRLFVPHIQSAASYTALRLGDFTLARQLRKRSLAISVENQDPAGIIWGKWELGEIERVEGNLADARQLYEESLKLFELSPQSNILIFYQRGLGDLALAQRNHAEAQARYKQSLELAQQVYHTWSVSYALSGLGRAEIGLGDWDAARGHFREALQKAVQAGARGLIMISLSGLAELASAQGADERAIELATFVTEQPETWQEVRRRTNKVLQDSISRLPEEAVLNAQVQARSWDLETLLLDLEADSSK